MKEASTNYYRLWLMEELAERSRRNTHYSLTAFAKQLDVSAPTLSQVILGKRPLTRKTALKIVSKCSFTSDQRKSFLASALNYKESAVPNANGDGPAYQDLEPEIFQLISKWYHYAILSLGDIKPNSSDPQWIADRLGISTREAAEAYERLLKLNLISGRKNGFAQTSQPLWMPTAASTNAVRMSHRQNLRKAEQALFNDSAKLELFSTMTLAVNERYLPEVRTAITEFRKTISGIVDRGNKNRVYTLGVQMFPVSK